MTTLVGELGRNPAVTWRWRTFSETSVVN